MHNFINNPKTKISLLADVSGEQFCEEGLVSKVSRPFLWLKLWWTPAEADVGNARAQEVERDVSNFSTGPTLRTKTEATLCIR